MRRYNKGWKGESQRHSLSRRGVRTGKKTSFAPLAAKGQKEYLRNLTADERHYVDLMMGKLAQYRGKENTLAFERNAAGNDMFTEYSVDDRGTVFHIIKTKESGIAYELYNDRHSRDWTTSYYPEGKYPDNITISKEYHGTGNGTYVALKKKGSGWVVQEQEDD